MSQTHQQTPDAPAKELALGNKAAAVTLAVKDLAQARAFYEDTLGLTRVESPDDEVMVFDSGGSTINVYRSEYAGTNQATAVCWPLGKDFDAIVRSLQSKGIAFEHYDMPGVTREGDVHVNGAMKVAWFKDPDGNILNVINQ